MLPLFLKIGLTIAFCHADGEDPYNRKRVNISQMGIERGSAVRLRNTYGMPSGEVLLRLGSRDKVRNITSGSKSTKSTLAEQDTLQCAVAVEGERLNADEKVDARILACSQGAECNVPVWSRGGITRDRSLTLGLAYL